MSEFIVKSVEDLQVANQPGSHIKLAADLSLDTPITLAPGISLSSQANHQLIFGPHCDGLGLAENCQITGIVIKAEARQKALFFDQNKTIGGHFLFKNLYVEGLVNLVIPNSIKPVVIRMEDIEIQKADATKETLRPKGYGVEVLQGALTIYSFDKKNKVQFTGHHIHIGKPDSPVNGSGVFISGTHGEAKVFISTLSTGPIYTNGLIKPETNNIISGGVFIVWNTEAQKVINHGIVQTFGYNDMVLDNWGTVHEWIAEKPILSDGASGIGFVNFGKIDRLVIRGGIETKGQGARGFNNYDGSVNHLEIANIITRGDGALGVQVSKPMGTIKIHKNIETFGGAGESLVKGVIKHLEASAISVLEGGEVDKILVDGNIIVHNSAVSEAVVIEGTIKNGLIVKGEIKSAYKNNKHHG